MSEKKEKKQKGKRLDLSVVAMVDNLVFSKKEVWAYYQIDTQAYDFLSHAGKLALGNSTTLGFANIMTEKDEPVDFHLINTFLPLDTEAWEKQVFEEVSEGRETPGLDNFIKDQRYFLDSQDYNTRITYLGVCLGKRGAIEASSVNFLEIGFKGAWEEIKKWGQKALFAPPDIISATEEDKYRKAESNLYSIIGQGHLQAEKVTSEDLLLLIKRMFYPAMPAPGLDVDHEYRVGPGDLELELYSGIKNRFRWLEFNHQIGRYDFTCYRATLTFSKFPKEMVFPASLPFFYLPSRFATPLTTYARFTLLPTKKMKSEVMKKQKELDDELANMAAGKDSMVNTGAEASEALGDSVLLDSILSSDKTPWVQGTYRIVIEADSEESLRDKIAEVKQEYASMNINLTHTGGDQAELFLEQMPGDRLREKSFQQTTNLFHIGTSGFNFSSAVGDRIMGRELR